MENRVEGVSFHPVQPAESKPEADEFLPEDILDLSDEYAKDYDMKAVVKEMDGLDKKAKQNKKPADSFNAKMGLESIKKLSDYEKRLPIESQIKLRAEKLAKFKENLINQKNGIARTIRELRESVEAVPNTTEEVLLSKVKNFAVEYGFTSEQIAAFKFAISEFRKKHKAVEEYRAKYPDDADLFEACFGRKPQGKIEIIKGPMTLLFRCFDRSDYAFIHSLRKHLGNEQMLKQEYMDMADKSGGMAVATAKIPELSGVIIVENVANNIQVAGYSERVRIHEEQHQFNRLFKPLEPMEDLMEMRRNIAESRKTGEELEKQAIHRYVKFERKSMGFDSDARDEMLAYYKDGRVLNDIFKFLTESDLYNYTKRYKDKIDKIPARAVRVLGAKFMFDDKGKIPPLSIKESSVQPYVELVFKDEYRADLQRWLDAISLLEQKGYKRNDIVHLLSQEPINSWPNLAKRMPSKIKNLK